MSGQDDRLVRRVVEAAARRGAGGPCPEPDVLGLYTDRGLDDAERGLVEAHVAGCARCQATVAALVRSAPEAADVAGAAASGAGGVRAWWTGWRWLVPAAATAAVVTLAVWVGRGPSERAAEADRVGATAAPAAAAVVTGCPPATRGPAGLAFGPRGDRPRAGGGPPGRRAGAGSLRESDHRAGETRPRAGSPRLFQRPRRRQGVRASPTRVAPAPPGVAPATDTPGADRARAPA